MAFPHPESRYDKHRNGHKPDYGRVIWKFFKWTINITDDRNTEDEVNRANDRTFGGILHDSFNKSILQKFELLKS